MSEAPEPLLPCPFCGGEAEIQAHGNESWVAHFALCLQCFSMGTNVLTRDEAVVAWNRRHPMVVEEGDVSELPEELRPGRTVI